MNRRGFLTGVLAACAAPAIVRVDSLMRVVPVETNVLTLDMMRDIRDIKWALQQYDMLYALTAQKITG